MMITVEPEIIIGNYIIELLNKSVRKFNKNELQKIDDELSSSLSKIGYYYKPLIFHINEFAEMYSMFVELKDNDVIIKDYAIENVSLVNRYFRLGCPKELINEIKKI